MCWNKEMHEKLVYGKEPFTPPPGMRHNYKTPYYSFIIIILFYSAIISVFTDNKPFTKPHHFNPSIHLLLLSKVFLNKYNKTFSWDLTWSFMTKCIMKKNRTCSAAALELTLASCFIRQFMRLIIHFFSELTSNHHRVFVITSFCDHMWKKNYAFKFLHSSHALTYIIINIYIYIYIHTLLLGFIF